MQQTQIQSKRNENRLLYDTRWRHPDFQNYIYIRARTPFNQIVERLQKIAQREYTYNQITALKQFYYNKKTKSGEPKWKKNNFLNWTIEYKVNNKYVWTIRDGLQNSVPKSKAYKSFSNQVWVHELYPVVDKVYVGSEKMKNIETLVKELNNKIKHPNIERFYSEIVNSMKKTKSIESLEERIYAELKIAHSYRPIFEKIDQLKKAEMITEKGIKTAFTKRLNQVKGWTIEKDE